MVAVLSDSGALLSQQSYMPFGQVRNSIGSITQTDFGYTGQRNEAYTDLMDYRSRWYDGLLGRFIQPDSIVPGAGNPQNLNRFAYVLNSPVKNTDPTGHCITGAVVDTIICAAIIGAIVSVAVDAYVTTQVNHQEYSWKEAAVAATVGAASGALAAGVIVPLAIAAGAGLATAATSLTFVSTSSAGTIATVGTVTSGMVLSGVANVGLSATQRQLKNAVNGKQVTGNIIGEDIQQNWSTDATYGAASFAIGYGYSNAANAFFWQQPEGIPSLLVPRLSHRVIIGAFQATGMAASDANVLQLPFVTRGKKSIIE